MHSAHQATVSCFLFFFWSGLLAFIDSCTIFITIPRVFEFLAQHDGEVIEGLVALFKPLFCFVSIQIVVFNRRDKIVP